MIAEGDFLFARQVWRRQQKILHFNSAIDSIFSIRSLLHGDWKRPAASPLRNRSGSFSAFSGLSVGLSFPVCCFFRFSRSVWHFLYFRFFHVMGVRCEKKQQKNFCFFHMYRRKLVLFVSRPKKQIKIETTCLQKKKNEI